MTNATKNTIKLEAYAAVGLLVLLGSGSLDNAPMVPTIRDYCALNEALGRKATEGERGHYVRAYTAHRAHHAGLSPEERLTLIANNMGLGELAEGYFG